MKKLFAANFLHVTLIGSTATGFISVALIDASVKSVILLLLAAIACFALVRASAATRHLVWTATMLGLLLMPACALLLPDWQVLPEWLSLENRIEIKGPPTQQLVLGTPISIDSTEMQEFAEAREGEVVPQAAFSIELQSVGSIPNPLETSTRASELASPTNSSPDLFQIRLPVPLVLGVSTSGFLVCFFPAVVSFFRLRSLERKYQTNQPLSAKSVRLIAKIANNLGVAQPRVFVGPAGTMPMVWSFGHSRLLVPSDIDHWSESKAKAILLHELVHLRRHDPLVCSLGLLARALNWFNPLAWYAVHRLRMECEQACDDQVLQHGIEASDYASHLLELSTFVRFESRTLPLAMAIATRPSVESRIASILDETQNRRGVTTARVFAMFVAVSIGVALLASAATRVVSEELTPEDSELLVANEASAEKAEAADRADDVAEDVEDDVVDDVVDDEFIAPLLDKVPSDKPVDRSGTIRKEDHEKFSHVDLSLEECIAHAIMNSKVIRTSSESKISESTFVASADASTAELAPRTKPQEKRPN